MEKRSISKVKTWLKEQYKAIEKRQVYAVICALLILAWSFYAEQKIFVLSNIINANQKILYWFCKILLCFITFLIYMGATNLFRDKNLSKYKFLLLEVILVFFCLLALYMKLYPGFWNGDTVCVLGYALNYQDGLFGQGLFTGLLFILTLMVFPIPQAVIIAQLLIFSVAVVHIGWMAVCILPLRKNAKTLLTLPYLTFVLYYYRPFCFTLVFLSAGSSSLF